MKVISEVIKYLGGVLGSGNADINSELENGETTIKDIVGMQPGEEMGLEELRESFKKVKEMEERLGAEQGEGKQAINKKRKTSPKKSAIPYERISTVETHMNTVEPPDGKIPSTVEPPDGKLSTVESLKPTTDGKIPNTVEDDREER